MLRAVLDANVLVSAAIGRDGRPLRLVRACLEGAFELVVSPRLLAELEHVLARPRIAARLDSGDVGRMQEALVRAAIHVEDPPAEHTITADAEDDYLVALARAGGARVIVTGDRHLLDLDGLEPPALTPRAFLGVVERIP